MTKKPIVLIAGTIIAATLLIYLSLAISCRNEKSDQDALSLQIDQLRPVMEVEVPGYDELDARLATAEDKLNALRSLIADDLSNARIIRSITELAHKNDVKALPLGSREIQDQLIEGEELWMLQVNLKAEGRFSNVLAFLDALEGGPITGLAVNEADLNRMDGDIWIADLELNVYADVIVVETVPGAK